MRRPRLPRPAGDRTPMALALVPRSQMAGASAPPPASDPAEPFTPDLTGDLVLLLSHLRKMERKAAVAAAAGVIHPEWRQLTAHARELAERVARSLPADLPEANP